MTPQVIQNLIPEIYQKELEDTIKFSIDLNKPVINKDIIYRFVLDTIKIPDSLYFFKLSKELNSFKGLFKLNQNISSLFLDNHKNIYTKIYIFFSFKNSLTLI